MSLKVLVVTAMYPHADRPNSGTFVMQQVEQLRAFQHHVDVLHIPGHRSKFEYVKGALEVWKRTRGANYDVVHAHYGLTGFAAIFRSATTPLVVTLHGSDALLGWIAPVISGWACHFADATIAVSRKIASKIPGEIIPCGVDLGVFTAKPRPEARMRLGLPLEKRFVLFPFDPARPVKRFDLARAAVARLASSGSNVELLAVSNVPNSEMPWYYSAADVMLLCSDSEGSPTAVKEALACNLPVVSTAVGDVPEILDGIMGAHICEQNADALAAGLRVSLDRPEGFVFDGRSAMQRYSQESTVRMILGVYSRVIEKRRMSCAEGRPSGGDPDRN